MVVLLMRYRANPYLKDAEGNVHMLLMYSCSLYIWYMIHVYILHRGT